MRTNFAKELKKFLLLFENENSINLQESKSRMLEVDVLNIIYIIKLCNICVLIYIYKN